MSAAKFIRNSWSHKTVTHGGSDWEFPGGGDTTLVPGDVADFVEQTCFREGLQIVHPEAEAAVRDALAAVGTPDLAAPPAPDPVEPEAPADEPKAESEAQPDPPAAPAPTATTARPTPAKPPKPAKKAAKKKG